MILIGYAFLVVFGETRLTRQSGREEGQSRIKGDNIKMILIFFVLSSGTDNESEQAMRVASPRRPRTPAVGAYLPSPSIFFVSRFEIYMYKYVNEIVSKMGNNKVRMKEERRLTVVVSTILLRPETS